PRSARRQLPALTALRLGPLLLPAGLIALRRTAVLLSAVLLTVLFLVELDGLAALGVLVLLLVGHVIALLFPRALRERACVQEGASDVPANADYDALRRRLARTIEALRARPSRRARLSGEPRNRSRNSVSVIATSSSAGGGGVAGGIARATGARRVHGHTFWAMSPTKGHSTDAAPDSSGIGPRCPIGSEA